MSDSKPARTVTVTLGISVSKTSPPERSRLLTGDAVTRCNKFSHHMSEEGRHRPRRNREPHPSTILTTHDAWKRGSSKCVDRLPCGHGRRTGSSLIADVQEILS